MSTAARVRSSIIAVTAALVTLLLLAAPAVRASTDPRLAQAESLARKHELDAAADLYRAMLGDGIDGADLHYNLGTLDLEEGKIGEAVLHLRHAQRLAPGDDDIRHNLEVALDARTDRLAGDAPADPVKAIGSRLGPGLARLLFALPLALLGLLLAALGLIDAERVRRALTWAAATTAVLAVVGCALWGCRKSVEATREAVIVVDATPALKEADEAAGVAFDAHAGLYGDVVDESGAFVRIRFENGLESWIKTTAVGTVR